MLWGMVQAPRLRTCHSLSEPGGFKNPQISDHLRGTPPGFHHSAGPGGTVKLVLANASKNNANGSRVTARLAAPCSAVEVARNHVRSTVRTVSCNFFPIPRSLEKLLLMCRRHHGKDRFAIARQPSERSTGHDSL